MNEESKPLFHNFRMLVFPMSLNAVGLGAAATFIFWLVSWLACQVAGGSAEASLATDRFLGEIGSLIVSGDWPSGVYTGQGWIFTLQLVLAFLLWATIGVAMCRILVLRIARDDVCPMGTAFAYAWRVKLTALLYPVAIAIPVLFLAVCNGAAGWVASIPYLGWLLGLLLVPLVMISCVLIVLALAVGAISLGLIPAIIATERKGTFDAAGKATNAITARPLSVVLYLALMYVFIVTFVYGLLLDADLVRKAAEHTLLPFGQTTFEDIGLGNTAVTDGFANWLAWICFGLWKLYRLVIWGLVLSLALGGFTSMFLILRREIDGIDPEDVAGEGDEELPAEDAPAPAAPPDEPGPALENSSPESGTPGDAPPAATSEEEKPEGDGPAAG